MSYPKKRIARVSRTKPYTNTIFRGSPKLWIYQSFYSLHHQVNSDGAPIKSSLQARWTRLRIQMDWISMLVSNIMSCSVTRRKSPPNSPAVTKQAQALPMIENPMKGKRGHVCGIPLVCPLVSPGFTKQTGNGRVRLSLVRPSSSGTACARTYVPLICGWGVGATHHPEKGVCAHTHAWACTGKIRGGHMCRQCRASGVRRRQPGLFQVQL